MSKPKIKRCNVRLMGHGFALPGYSCVGLGGEGYGTSPASAYKAWSLTQVNGEPPARDWLATPWGILLALLTGGSVAYMWGIFK